MKKIRTLFLPLLSVAIIAITVAAGSSKSSTSSTDTRTIITELFKSIDNAKTLTYNMVYSERLDDGKIHRDSNSVKYQKMPLKIYIKTAENVEILWPVAEDITSAWVHPSSFPYITLKLDPDGSIMRKNQHHGVQSTGYEYFGSVLKQAASKAGADFDSRFIYLGEVDYNGIKCHKLNVIEPGFTYVPYKVLEGETVLTIAAKLKLSEYMILTHNKLSSYTSVDNGQTIMIPTSYAKAMTLYINESSMLPLLIKVEDDRGQFEQYYFKNVKTNVFLSDYDFSKKNKDYNF